MEVLLVILGFVALIALSGMALGFVDGRRKHRVELRKEERRMVEARAKEQEAKNRQTELEYRNAMAELERFDRRTGGVAGLAAEPASPEPATPEPASPEPAPALPERAAGPADPD